jgi:hypothetical protein
MKYINGTARRTYKTFEGGYDVEYVDVTNEEWDRLQEESREILSTKNGTVLVGKEEQVRNLYKK